jgi:hypothetical protein
MRGNNRSWSFRPGQCHAVAAVVLLAVVLAGCTDLPTDPRFATGGPSSIGSFTLPAVEVTACQYGGFYPDCKSPPPSGGTVAPTSPSSPSGPNSGGGTTGSGGTPTPPPDTTRRPPCNTTDSIINYPAVQAALRNLWVSSNPSATNMYERKEQGGWIVSAGTSAYSFVPFSNVTNLAYEIIPDGGHSSHRRGIVW